MGKSLNRTFAERGLGTFWEVPGGFSNHKGQSKNNELQWKTPVGFPSSSLPRAITVKDVGVW